MSDSLSIVYTIFSLKSSYLLFQEPADAQQLFLSTHHPIVWQIVPTIEFLMKHWDTMVKEPCFKDIKLPIQWGIVRG
jgi:hypothetical protein